MGDMDVSKPGIIGKFTHFIKKDITGEEPEKDKPAIWGEDTRDYVTKGAIMGTMIGAGAGVVADRLEAGKSITYEYKEPIMEKKVIGEIPQDHISSKPDVADPKYVDEKGKPQPGMGVKIYGEGPKRNILGMIQYEEKTGTAEWKGHSLAYYLIGGAIIGCIGGIAAGFAAKTIGKILHPPPPPNWDKSAPQSWNQSAPAWDNSAHSRAPWNQSAPAWDNTHTKAPYNDTHHRYSDYSDIHHRYSDWSNVHHRYSDWSNSHSNAPHSNAPVWDKSVTYGG